MKLEQFEKLGFKTFENKSDFTDLYRDQYYW